MEQDRIQSFFVADEKCFRYASEYTLLKNPFLWSKLLYVQMFARHYNISQVTVTLSTRNSNIPANPSGRVV